MTPNLPVQMSDAITDADPHAKLEKYARLLKAWYQKPVIDLGVTNIWMMGLIAAVDEIDKLACSIPEKSISPETEK